MGSPSQDTSVEALSTRLGKLRLTRTSDRDAEGSSQRPKWTCTSNNAALEENLLSDRASYWGGNRLFQWDKAKRGVVRNSRTGITAAVVNPNERIAVGPEDMQTDQLIAGAVAKTMVKLGWNVEIWPDEEGNLRTGSLEEIVQTEALITVKATWATWGTADEAEVAQYIPTDGFMLAAETLKLLEEEANNRPSFLERWHREWGNAAEG